MSNENLTLGQVAMIAELRDKLEKAHKDNARLRTDMGEILKKVQLLKAKMELNDIANSIYPPIHPVQLIIDTIQTLAEQGYHNAGLFELAKAIKPENIWHSKVCSICSEEQCDKGCPFQTLREMNKK